MTGYETAATHRAGLRPGLPAGLQRVLAWRIKPELCDRCRRRAADILDEGRRAQCRACYTAGTGDTATRQRQQRQAAIAASIRQDDIGHGLIGLAVPFGEPVELTAGQWEQFERGAFRYSPTMVALTQRHGGPELVKARAFELPTGLYFEAPQVPRQADVLRGGGKVSIKFGDSSSTYEPYRGGRLRRIHDARLTEIALLNAPAYPMTWAAPRSPEAWQRAYAGAQRVLRDIAQGHA